MARSVSLLRSPQGVHFIGSVPCDSTEETLTLLSKTLPHHIRRLPDGEPATRQNFIYFQHYLFKPYPQLLNARYNPDATTSGASFDDETLKEVRDHLSKLETGYDSAAIESYAVFKKLRAEGVVPQGVRFQVCIPTPLNAISSSIAANYRTLVEPYYAAALVRALQNIQSQIPHEDLAIQIDCAHEFGLLEQIWKLPGEDRFAPWWTTELSNEDELFIPVVDRIVAFAGQGHVAKDVELGFHFCYGDIGHKHFVEPKDTGLMVKVARAVFPRLAEQGRVVTFFHAPVPKERDDETYSAPLRELIPLLREGGTELYLGLVREGDEEGTNRRIETARKVVGEEVSWGVASECGMGRTPRDQVASILAIMKAVARPVR
jgi:methionine synthase II (cobalamin-independent)